MSADLIIGAAAEPERLRRFIAELEAEGFNQIDDIAWSGPVHRSLVDGGHTDADQMTFYFRPSWPYLPPLLHVPGIAAWHADQELLCIWQADDNSQRWTTLQGVYDRIDEWVSDAARGFADVENARNPEIYWEQPGERVVGLVDVDELLAGRPNDGQHGEFHFVDAVSADGRRSPGPVFELRPGAFSAMTGLPEDVGDHHAVRGRWFYRERISHPPRTFDEFRQFLTGKQRLRLDRDLRDRPLVMFGLFWRNAAGLVGTVLLARRTSETEVALFLVVLRPNSRAALLLRAGPDAVRLQDASVAIIGVGAVGSHVAEQLARAGVGRLLLIDRDRLWPANLIRHAAPPGTPAATLKTAAMHQQLSQYPWVEIRTQDGDDGALWTANQLRAVLDAADLTIDATGHGGLAEWTARVAHANGRAFISAALFRGGAVARIRRQARETDAPLIQRPHFDRYPEIPPLDEEAEYAGTETGCLARVHNAPPVAVTLAAALTAEVAIDHLTGRHHQPDEIIEVIRPGDAPFNRPGRLRPEDLPATVDISETAQASMRDAAAAAAPNEAHGILLGCTIDDRTTIAAAIEVPDRNAGTGRDSIPADKIAGIVTHARHRDPRLAYIGVWHSHTDQSRPSAIDSPMLPPMVDDREGRGLAIVIVHPDKQRPDDIRAYTTESGTLRPARICATGDLPMADA